MTVTGIERAAFGDRLYEFALLRTPFSIHTRSTFPLRFLEVKTMTFQTTFDSQFIPAEGFEVQPLVTIGETIPGTTGALNSSTAGDYQPVGILDGAGAIQFDEDTVRAFVNHELNNDDGIEYTLTNEAANAGEVAGVEGTFPEFTLVGGRISYFDINIDTFQIEDAGIAYNTIVDADGNIAVDETFQPESAPNLEDGQLLGFSRFCSGGLSPANEFGEGRGIVDDIYFAGEEDGGGFNTAGGSNWALDIATGVIYQLPALGRGSWENTTQIDTGTDEFVAFILADDQSPFNFDDDTTTGFPGDPNDDTFPGGEEAAPLYLYIGEKNPDSEDFLEKNGLADGQLYVFVPTEGQIEPDPVAGQIGPLQFNGAGSQLEGIWVPIDNDEVDEAGNPNPASEDGSTGFDPFGYPTQATLFSQAQEAGALAVSRPEDVATNPNNPSQVAQALTGVDDFAIDPESGNGADTFGQILLIDTFFEGLTPGVDLSTLETDGLVTIVYDGDEDPNRTLRSPDNLDFSADGFIYVQEDEAEEDTQSGDEILFGETAINPLDATIVRIDVNGLDTSDPASVAANAELAATGANVELVGEVDRTQIFDPSIPNPIEAVDEDMGVGGGDDPSNIPSGPDAVLDPGEFEVIAPDGTTLFLDGGEVETSGIVDVSGLFNEEPGNVFLFDVQFHTLADQDEENLTSGELSALTDDNLVEGGQLALLFSVDDAPAPANVVVGTDGDDALAAGVDFVAGDTVLSGAGADDIDLGLIAAGDNIALSGSDADAIFLGGDGIVSGGSGDDTIDGSTSTGSNRASGGAGADTFIVGTGDSLLGGADDDTFLVTELGGNTLAGGDGADTFIFSEVTDAVNTITDFEDGVDILQLDGIADLAADGDTISAGGVDFLVLLGVEDASGLLPA